MRPQAASRSSTTRHGKPVVRVGPLPTRFGFLEGVVPELTMSREEFKAIAADEIRLMEDGPLFPDEDGEP